MKSSSDLGSDLDENEWGLLGNEGACDVGREVGRDGLSTLDGGAVLGDDCRIASCRNSSVLLGLIVDLLLLPSLRSVVLVAALLGDVLVFCLAPSTVSCSVCTCEPPWEGLDVLEAFRARSDSEARKKALGPASEEGTIGCSFDCLRERAAPSKAALLGRILRHEQRQELMISEQMRLEEAVEASVTIRPYLRGFYAVVRLAPAPAGVLTCFKRAG